MLKCIVEMLHNVSLQEDLVLFEYCRALISLQGLKGQETTACVCPGSQLPFPSPISAKVALLLLRVAQGVSDMFPNPQFSHLISLVTLL